MSARPGVDGYSGKQDPGDEPIMEDLLEFLLRPDGRSGNAPVDFAEDGFGRTVKSHGVFLALGLGPGRVAAEVMETLQVFSG